MERAHPRALKHSLTPAGTDPTFTVSPKVGMPSRYGPHHLFSVTTIEGARRMVEAKKPTKATTPSKTAKRATPNTAPATPAYVSKYMVGDQIW